MQTREELIDTIDAQPRASSNIERFNKRNDSMQVIDDDLIDIVADAPVEIITPEYIEPIVSEIIDTEALEEEIEVTTEDKIEAVKSRINGCKSGVAVSQAWSDNEVFLLNLKSGNLAQYTDIYETMMAKKKELRG